MKAPEGFTPEQQKKFNDAIAAERRKQETKYRKELEKTETTYKELLANNKSLTEKERQTLQENLETIQGQLRSKEQQAAQEKKDLEASYQGKLTVAERRAEKRRFGGVIRRLRGPCRMPPWSMKRTTPARS